MRVSSNERPAPSPQQLRDAELLRQWRSGDNRAGAALYDQHSPTVYRLFQTKVPQEAEELTQQTFLAVVESKDRIREGSSLRAYILGIARFKLIDHLHARARNRGVAFDSQRQSLVEVEPGPSSVLARKREHQLLLEGLRRIPVEHQLALELFYWEGLKAKDIADVFGVSASAMRSRLGKARQLLEAAITKLPASAAERDSTLSGLETWAARVREIL